MQLALPEIPLVKNNIDSIVEELSLKLSVNPQQLFHREVLGKIVADLGLEMGVSSGCIRIASESRNCTRRIRLLPAAEVPNCLAIGLGTLAALKSIRPDLPVACMLLPAQDDSTSTSTASEGEKNLFYSMDNSIPAGKVSVGSGMVFPATIKFTLTIPGSGSATEPQDNSIAMIARLINGLGQSVSRLNDPLSPVKLAYTSIQSQKNGGVVVRCTASVLRTDMEMVQGLFETYVHNFASLYNIPCQFQVIEFNHGIQTDLQFSQVLRQSVAEISASGLTELSEHSVLQLENLCCLPVPTALLLVGCRRPESEASHQNIDIEAIRAGIQILAWLCLKNISAS